MRRIAIVVGLLLGSVAVVGATEAGDRRPRVVSSRQHNVSVSFASGDPARALAKAERVLTSAGGHIEHSNGNQNNANMSARLPPSRVEDALAGLRRIGGKLTGISRSTSDMTANLKQNRDRLADLVLAEAAVTEAMKTASADQLRGLVVLFELAQRERRSVETTVNTLETQTATAVVNISISRAN